LLAVGAVQDPGEHLRTGRQPVLARHLAARAAPLGGGESRADQRQALPLLVPEVAGQRAGQGVDDVGQAVAAGSGELRVHGGQQRVDELVLGLQRVEDRQRGRAVGQAGAQCGPDDLVLGGVVQVQLTLEQVPPDRDRLAPGRVGQVRGAGRPGQPGQVAAERVVRREHDGQVRVPRAVPGRVSTRQLLRGHECPSVLRRTGIPRARLSLLRTVSAVLM
jgi:hypothetical protein